MIKVFELFAGIGAVRKALDNLGIPYESIGYSEIDKSAIKAYCSIHGDVPENNYGDITKIQQYPQDIDLLCGGFPCQDISKAGLGKGIVKGKTRSGLMFDMMHFIEQTKPKCVITENVKDFLNKKNTPQFNLYVNFLKEQGYSVTYKVLNAKYFGIPQNRERVFIIANKDYAVNLDFDNLTEADNLTDFVEFDTLEEVSLKIPQATKSGWIELKTHGIPNLGFPNSKTRRGRVINAGKLIPTLQTSHEFYAISKKHGEFVNTNSKTSKLGYFNKDYLDKRVYHVYDNAVSVVTANNPYYTDFLKIRKLTAKECLLLMGFKENNYNKISSLKDSTIIKLAGNSIVVPVIEEILKKIYKGIK